MSTHTVKRWLLIVAAFSLGWASWLKMPISKAADEADFLSFHHPPMGLTLSYPADWRLETRDMIKLPPAPENLPEGFSNEEDTEGYKTFGNQIKLYSPTFKDNRLDEVYIFINSNRVSASGDLDTVVALQNELNQIDSDLVDSTTITVTKSVSVTRQTPEGVDDAVAVSAKNPLMQSAAIWLAKDGLIFGVATASENPDVIAMMYKIISTFTFDGTTKELSEKYKKYTSDADALRIAIEASRPLPQPECDIVCRDAKERGEAPNLLYLDLWSRQHWRR